MNSLQELLIIYNKIMGSNASYVAPNLVNWAGSNPGSGYYETNYADGTYIGIRYTTPPAGGQQTAPYDEQHWQGAYGSGSKALGSAAPNGNKNDWLVFTTNSNAGGVLWGGDGNDTLSGSMNDDFLITGSGNRSHLIIKK